MVEEEEAHDDVETSNRNTTRNNGGLDRSQKLGILAVVALTIMGGLVVAVVVLVPSTSSSSSNNNNSSTSKQASSSIQRALQTSSPPSPAPSLNPSSSAAPTDSPAPSSAPTISSAPSTSPSSSPTMAPTIPELGCRGDRFDNEGNYERNNRLFAGQYVCSDDDDQRYRFGIDPETGNLILRDTQTNTLRTYYWNDYHTSILENNEQQRQRRRNTVEDQNSTLSGNGTITNITTGDVTVDPSEPELDAPKDCEDGIPAEDEANESTTSVSYSLQTKVRHNNCTDTDNNDNDLPDAPSTTTTTTSVVVESAIEVEQPTVLDYYFSLSTKAAFRIHRVQRSEDYQIISQELHWELPSTYNITVWYENCLKTHDCPYVHLHRDGVMVLAWLDFVLSEWNDGWMEKNIRRCYDFNTTDQL